VAGYGKVNLQGNVKNDFTNFAPRLGIAYEATPKTVVRMGYGRSFDIGVFGSIFGHTATQNLPVLVAQQLNPSSNTGSVFALSEGPPAPPFVSVPASGQFLLPDQVGAFVLPRKLRLPTLDAWNLTVQHQITPTLSLAVGYVANKGTHVFAGDAPDYDPNQATIVGFGSLDTNERNHSSANSAGRSNLVILAMTPPTPTTPYKWWRISGSPGDIIFSPTTPGQKLWATTATITRSIQN